MPVLKVKNGGVWETLSGNAYIDNVTPADIGALDVDITDFEQGEAAGVNADYLGGVAASGYVQKGEVVAMAADSQMLSGQAASYYIPPVGIILPFWNEVEPASIWGGTWELLEEGRTLIQSGDNYTLGIPGGEATHTLSIDEMPSHNHTVGRNTAGGSYFGLSSYETQDTPYMASTSYTGGSQPHNNMPPYLPVNIWMRTA